MVFRHTIFFVNDSKEYADSETVRILRKNNYEVIESGPDISSIPLVGRKAAGLIIFAVSRGGTESAGKIKHLQRLCPGKPLLIISQETSSRLIIDSFRLGICDFFQYPVPYRELLNSIADNIVKGSPGAGEEPVPVTPVTGRRFIGESEVMRKVKHRLQQIAGTDATVLITGETGTGKDLAGEYIHRASRRSSNPYIAINCAALPDGLVESELFGYEKGAFTGADSVKTGKFELAEGGTLFLDEIGEMPLQLQAKLLYAIEKKSIFRIGGKREIPVDVKIVAATNKDIKRSVKVGSFRIDLYYRLNVAGVHMPSLRERKNDLDLLVEHIIDKMSNRYQKRVDQYSEEDMAMMHRYDWPGNVRELQNTIEMSFIDLLGTKKHVLKLPHDFKKSLLIKKTSGRVERQLLVTALLANNWNKTKTAEELKWSRMTVHRKINKYNIVRKRKRSHLS